MTSRRRQALTAAAPVPYLSVPVDLVLADWVSRASAHKESCGGPLPGYQTALASLVPVLFVVLALVCGVAGLVILIRGRRDGIQADRIAGRTALALSAPAVVISLIFAAPAWFAVGFSTWCF